MLTQSLAGLVAGQVDWQVAMDAGLMPHGTMRNCAIFNSIDDEPSVLSYTSSQSIISLTKLYYICRVRYDELPDLDLV